MEKIVPILDIPFIHSTKKEMIQTLYNRIQAQEKVFVVTANPEIAMVAHLNKSYGTIVKSADYVVADGIGVIYASRMLKTPLPERIPGFELTLELLQLASQEQWRVYFLGAKPEVIEILLNKVKEQYPNMVVAGAHHGFFNGKEQEVLTSVVEAKPDIVFVALGCPRQEEWIAKNIHHFDKGLFMGVGGSFDGIAGTMKRAPVIWQKLNLEWLHRLIKQPSRWRRMLMLPKFMIEVWKSKRVKG